MHATARQASNAPKQGYIAEAGEGLGEGRTSAHASQKARAQTAWIQPDGMKNVLPGCSRTTNMPDTLSPKNAMDVETCHSYTAKSDPVPFPPTHRTHPAESKSNNGEGSHRVRNWHCTV